MPHKKAAAYIAYILLIMMTVVIATSIILWSTRTTEELTKGSVNLASGRLECKEVRIDAVPNVGCTSITIINKGMINIENARVTFDNSLQKDSGNLFVSSEVEVTNDSPFKKAVVLPIVKERENLFGCNDKKLVLNCP